MTITQIVIANLFMIIKIQVTTLPSRFRDTCDVLVAILIIHFLSGWHIVCCLDVREHPEITSQTV